jgi:hypothetical protein
LAVFLRKLDGGILREQLPVELLMNLLPGRQRPKITFTDSRIKGESSFGT